MGAAAATAKQPLAEVDIKNEIGVLYGEEARQAGGGEARGQVPQQGGPGVPAP